MTGEVVAATESAMVIDATVVVCAIVGAGTVCEVVADTSGCQGGEANRMDVTVCAMVM